MINKNIKKIKEIIELLRRLRERGVDVKQICLEDELLFDVAKSDYFVHCYEYRIDVEIKENELGNLHGASVMRKNG